MKKYQKLEADIARDSKKNGTWLAEELSAWCLDNYQDITKIFKKLTPEFQRRIKQEYIDRNLVEMNESAGLGKFFQ